jgi:sialic acid synthase SpsE
MSTPQTASAAIWKKLQTGVFIIAEAGKNFICSADDRSVSEYLVNAKQLVDKAVWAGADAIKFQTHTVTDEQLNIPVTSHHFTLVDRYRWIERNTNATPLETFWCPLKQYCDEQGIVFMSTPMSRASAYTLQAVGVPVWKVGSADILDFVCLDVLRQSQLPIILSSGMSTLDELKQAVTFIGETNPQLALMHCLSKYPGLPEEANLATLTVLRETFPGHPVGFSENSLGIDTSVCAVALGATIIEKHITLDRAAWGPDHKVSSTPEEFHSLVTAIRAVETDSTERDRWLRHPQISAMLGTKQKVLQPAEATFRPLFRKALVASHDISSGTVLAPADLYAMRPQAYINGFPSEAYATVLGKTVHHPLKMYDPINSACFTV